jgi:tetratricopeptide (TPR) repeat protein
MHVMFSDNIMVLKELAELNFQQKKHPESLLYYQKLLFLDSFNTVAQERVKQLQGLLEAGVSAKLDDTKVEIFQEDSVARELSAPPQITFEVESGTTVLADEKGTQPQGEEKPFETESAAELYFKQGLYRESLAIYKNLFEKTGRTDFFMKIKAILLLQRTEKSNQVIEQLQRFLQLIQQRGSQIV